jgi:hypothetical protein
MMHGKKYGNKWLLPNWHIIFHFPGRPEKVRICPAFEPRTSQISIQGIL